MNIIELKQNEVSHVSGGLGLKGFLQYGLRSAVFGGAMALIHEGRPTAPGALGAVREFFKPGKYLTSTLIGTAICFTVNWIADQF